MSGEPEKLANKTETVSYNDLKMKDTASMNQNAEVGEEIEELLS